MLAAERQPLLARVHAAVAAPGGRLLIVGEPGIGKTTLLDEALRAATADGVRVLHARASEPKAGQPFHALIDLLAQIEPEHLDRLPPLQREAIEVALARRQIERDLPPMALPAAVAALVFGLLLDQQVVIAVDDLPWLDAESAALLQYVLSRPAQQNRMASLVATQRIDAILSGESDQIDRSFFTPAQIMHLPGLAIESLAVVINAAVGRRLPGPTLAAIHASTGGNPLWAIEVAQSRLDPATGTPADLRLPASIAEVVLAYITSLPADVAEVLSIVSAMGSAPAAVLLEMIADGGQAMVSAIDLGVVSRRHGLLRPTHPLLGSAALDAIGPGEQMKLHGRIARFSASAVERAYHRDLATPPGTDETVAGQLAEAATESRARGAAASALVQAERALTRTAPDSPNRIGRLIRIAELALATGLFDRAIAALEQVPLQTVDLALLDRALPLLFDALLVDRGEEATLRELDRICAGASGSVVREAMISSYRAEAQSYSAAERRGYADRALEALGSNADLPITLHRTLGSLALAKFDAGEGLDYELLARCQTLEQRLSFVAPNDTAEAQQGLYAFQAGDLDKSRPALKNVIQRAGDCGDQVVAGLFLVALATVEILAGRPELAARHLQEFDVDDPWPEAPVPSVIRARGLLAISQGDGETLDALLRLPHGPGSEPIGRFTRRALAGIYAARTENWPVAVPLLQEALQLAQSRGVHEPGRRMWVDLELTEALIAVGRRDEAGPVLDLISAVAARTRHPMISGVVLRLRGLLTAADRNLPAADRLLTESAAMLSATGFRAEHARTLLELGRVLRRRRARLRAHQALEEALRIAVEIQDGPLQERIRRAVEAASTTRGGEILTPTETRIATAIAKGMSNKEVASAQFISVRTVEAHVTAIYRKLKVRSRSQLTARLQESGTANTGMLRRVVPDGGAASTESDVCC